MNVIVLNKLSTLILSIAFLISNHSAAQSVNLGIPPVWNFSKKTYKAGTQNWDAAQDSRGVMYFANNGGLLCYDGSNWTCLPVRNKTVVRSVAINPEGRIFVGAQSDFGYFFPEKNGQLTYHSLVDLLPVDKRNFEDVWDIVFSNNEVFFRTNRQVFQYNGQEIKTHETGGELMALFSTSKGLILQQNWQELMLFENNAFKPIFNIPTLRSALTGAMPWQGDTLLFSSLKNGLFYFKNNQIGAWKTQNDAFLQEKRIYAAIVLPDGKLGLGTSLDGLVVLDEKRRIFRHLDNKNGLQNNNILCVFSDKSGNLWLGLDSGIDCAVLYSPFSSILPDGELKGTGYSAAVFEQQLYLGVSNGVYRADWRQFYDPEKVHLFEKIKATDGQVWSLNVLENELLLGHHEGAFSLNTNGTTQLSSEPGAWTFVPLSANYLLGGTYNGLVLYKKVGQKWVFDQKLQGLNESCRIMVKDENGAIWVAHPYRGLYRIEWSESQKSEIKVTFFNAKNGLPSDLNNFVFQIAGKAVFATEKGILRFDKSSASFVSDADFNTLLGKSGQVRLLREDTKGNIWYVSEREVGVLMVDDFGLKKSVKKKVFPELSEKLVAGFEFIYPVDAENVFFGAEQGFIHYNAAVGMASDTVLQVVLSNISASGTQDTVLFQGSFFDGNGLRNAQNTEDLPVLEAGDNNLRFAYSATDYKDPGFLQYHSRLLGLSGDWSEWSAESVRNFTNLSPGKYTFEVQALRKDGRESAILSYSFRIRPPWYASTLAMVLYGISLVSLFLGFLFGQQRKFESEKGQLTAQHEQKEAETLREVERSKAALIETQNANLEAEISFKTQELASSTMHLVQKGEILLTVQEHLNSILAKQSSPEIKKEIQQLLNLLNFDAQLDADWEQFAFHFDKVHVDFLKRLRDLYPQLGANDYKLSAYLRMNLTTKEIAPLMNISVRGVEASRYRLRKKLDLANDANLTEFMMGV
jgi:DNA-binding CsgD family transcriptional regulator